MRQKKLVMRVEMQYIISHGSGYRRHSRLNLCRGLRVQLKHLSLVRMYVDIDRWIVHEYYE